uniref:Uncharacterized protein n=1 Tax=Petromyzon marinus TaxID=7757 RepID=S4RA68_PETMA
RTVAGLPFYDSYILNAAVWKGWTTMADIPSNVCG